MRSLVATLILCVCIPFSASAEIPTPAETFGHEVGADYKLIPYPEVLSYLDIVAAASDRVSIEDAGRSTLDNPMKVVVLTSKENQANLERLREIARLLAKPGDLTPEQSQQLASRLPKTRKNLRGWTRWCCWSCRPSTPTAS